MSTVRAPAEAYEVLEAFTAAFNRQDAAGMDATLHFPHMFLGTRPVVWDKPGSLSPEFFPTLVQSGWAFSRYTRREPVLATTERVHFLVEYERCRADGAVLTKQAALWIVCLIDGRWGIQIRSME